MRRLQIQPLVWGLMVLILFLFILGRKDWAPELVDAGFLYGEEVELVHVLDGDTLDVRPPGGERFRLRLLGMDTMEFHNAEKRAIQMKAWQRSSQDIVYFAREARFALCDLVKDSRLVIISPDGVSKMDPYGRRLGYLEAEGVDVGEVLVAAGLAEVRREPHPRQTRYREAFRQAQEKKLGLHGS